MIKKFILVLSPVILLSTACAPKFSASQIASLAPDINNGIACENARSKIFDAYYKAYQQDKGLAHSLTARQQLQENSLNYPALENAPSGLRARYANSILKVHTLFTEDLEKIRRNIQIKTKALSEDPSTEDLQPSEDDPILHLIRLEMRSELDSSYMDLNQKLDKALAEASLAAQQTQLSCGQTSSSEPAFNTEPSSASATTPLYGAYFTMATAYQNCTVLELPLVNKSTVTAEGVVKGAKVDESGYGRVYTDVQKLMKTHYYHRAQAAYDPGCVNQNQKPLVYDYGGKPVVQTQGLNLFVNSGGGSALGIDCSAFISTAAAVAGNLYTPSSTNKPYYSRFTSRDFIDPEKSKWSCYAFVEINKNKSIQPGDIGSVEGHVVMVDKVGTDPFGLAKVTNVAGCDSLSTKNFDFSVVQSSPEKGSIGINRFEAKDYLTGTGKMPSLFLDYAKQACLSRFDGITKNPKTSKHSIIRHKQTANCLAQRISLVNESCIQRCPTLN